MTRYVCHQCAVVDTSYTTDVAHAYVTANCHSCGKRRVCCILDDVTKTVPDPKQTDE